MLLVLSHVLTFSALFVASLFDLDSTDVPDIFAMVAIVGGILLHGIKSLESGIMFEQVVESIPVFYSWSLGFLFTGNPVEVMTAFLSGLGEPLAYSLVTGSVLFGYGWLAYMRGMWGGADTLGIAALGFGAPFVPPSASYIEPLNLFVNVMLGGFIYILAFSLFRGLRKIDDFSLYRDRLVNEKNRIAVEVAGVLGFAGVMWYLNTSWIPVLAFFLPMVFVMRFLKLVQDELMFIEKEVNEVEPGEVPAPGQGLGDTIKGLEEEDIENFEGDTIEVREGVPFMPVFPVALLLTDVLVVGVPFLLNIF